MRPRCPAAESFDSPIDRRSDFYRQQALLQQFNQGKLKPQPLLTPPNVCTFARIALVPLFVVLWHTTHEKASIATAGVFIAAAVTDWLDGYLARRVRPCCCEGGCALWICLSCGHPWARRLMHCNNSSAAPVLLMALQLKVTSAFGAFLDPVADKIM